VEEARLSGHVDMAIADINTALNLSLPTDGSVDSARIAPHLDAIRAYVSQRVSVAVNGGTADLPLTGFDFATLNIAQYLQLNFAFDDLTAEPRTIDVEYDVLFDVAPEHRGMVVIESYFKTGTFDDEANVVLVFTPDSGRQTIDLSSSSVWRGFMALVGMGTHHIWIGIDHILFLLALLLPAVVTREGGRWQPTRQFRSALIHVVKVVTVFTIAHTITLSLAALNAVSMSSRVVESIIAISIAIAALDIVVPIFKERIWWIVFAFGLFHGFGFASVLSSIGIPSRYMVHSLLGFNLGVEIGQVVIVCALFPLLYLMRKHWLYVKGVLPVGAGALIAVSLYWFVERAFEVDLPAGALVNRVFGL
jgi:hypothetical protein